MFRREFDPQRPVVATSAFNDVAGGDVFDWRARGMSEIDVMPMFASGLLEHVDTQTTVDELSVPVQLIDIAPVPTKKRR